MTFKSISSFKPILLATAAALLLAVPAVGYAQDRPDDRGGPGERRGDGERSKERPAEQARPAPPAAPQAGPPHAPAPAPAPVPAPRADAPRTDGRPAGRPFERGGIRPEGPQPRAAQPQAVPPPQAQEQRREPDFRGRQAGPPPGFGPGIDRRAEERRGEAPRPDFRAPPRSFEARHPPEFHAQERRDFRSDNRDWGTRTVWRGNPNWWRGNPFFQDYRGPRVNFFFAPGFGYYSVPNQYYGRRWNPGDYLPAFFLNYTVEDYSAYGLPRPPYGCEWVWVNNNVLLIDESDGYILDEVYNVW